jgi:hypothetical protein
MPHVLRHGIPGIFEAPLTNVEALACLADELFRVEGGKPWFHPAVAEYHLEDVGGSGFFAFEAIEGCGATRLIVVFDLLQEVGHWASDS